MGEADALAAIDPFKDDHDATEIFHESTKMTPVNLYGLGKRVGAISSTPSLHELTMLSFKTYGAASKVPLPRSSLPGMTLEDAFRRRRSQTGDFSGASITAEQLSAILRYSAGPTTKPPASGVYPPEAMHLRAAASGGGLHPAEIYPVVLNVEGVATGVYHYSVRDHSLEELRLGPCRDALLRTLTDPRPADTSAVAFLLTSVMPRNLSKYLFRGYRFLSYDQGCLLSNFYLTSTALGLAACAIGGFYDNDAGAFLDVDNVHECVMMLVAVGHKAPGPLAEKILEPLAY